MTYFFYVLGCEQMKLQLCFKSLSSFLFTICALVFFAPFVQADSAKTPLYSDYNTFLDMENFLELVNAGTVTTDVTYVIYSLTGEEIASNVVRLSPGEQKDISINEIVVDEDTYGVVKVSYNDSNTDKRVIGRVSVYRTEPSDSSKYSFAFAKELQRPLTDKTFAPANSFDAQGNGRTVLNWAQIINLDSKTHTYIQKLYDLAGVLLETNTITLRPFQRLDFAAGHQYGENVYLSEFDPQDLTTEYLATITRYGVGDTGDSRIFAAPVNARTGISHDQFVPIFNESGNCFTETNWVEIINVGTQTSSPLIRFYDSSGNLLDVTSATLNPGQQYHYNASAILEAGSRRTFGSTQISGDQTVNILVQSAVYVHSCNDNLLNTSFQVEGSEPKDLPITGSYNRFLSMANDLYTYSTVGSSQSAALSLATSGNTIFTGSNNISSHGALKQSLNDSTFGTTANTYGIVALDSNRPEGVLGVNLRIKRYTFNSSVIDYIVPIPVR